MSPANPADPDKASPAGTIPVGEVGDWWATAISDIQPGVIRLRGYAVEELIGGAGFAQVVWLMVRGELPTSDEAALLELTLVAAVDHGPQAPSIAAARMAASCGLDLNNAMATGVNLLGDVHGGAGQQCMQVLLDLRASVDAGESPESAARALVTEYESRKAFIPGFGHRFHPHDPRRDPLLKATAAAVEAGVIEGRYLELALALEGVLAEGSTPIPMNVDGATATIYAELGFAPELARGLFVLSRSVGLLAHAWEQSNTPTRIKGPLPKSILPTYTGPPPRPLPT